MIRMKNCFLDPTSAAVAVAVDRSRVLALEVGREGELPLDVEGLAWPPLDDGAV
jgi:hypothetical protein